MLYAIVAVIAIIMDQLVKYVVETHVPLDAIGEDIVRLIPGLLHVTNVHNYGAAFSFLSGAGARWFFVVLCIIFVLVVIYVLMKDIINTPVSRWMAVIVLAGAVGNCIDRIVCGYVVDMLELEFIRFPVFNVADIFITVGAILFCICILLEKPKSENVKAEANLTEDHTAAIPQMDVHVDSAKPEKTPITKIPLFRKRQKFELPDFPKHAPAAAVPAMDPNDPFAEWEKRANMASVSAAVPATHETETQTVAAEAPEETVLFTPPAVTTPAEESAQFAEEPVIPVIPPAPAAPAAPVVNAQPAAAVAPAQPAPAAEEFNLDDILAEFKDL